ncbi:MAG TPA: S1 family peptidase, partial [Streptomyces sp.]|nr:S1 family peptidase [Streptomyces sp.]
MNSRRSALSRTASAAAASALLLLGTASAAAAAEPGSGGSSSAGRELPAEAEQSVIRGGDSVYAPGRVCTVGFNATDGSQDYAIASGRCVSGATTWYADAAMTVPVGATAGTSFPGDDYGLIRYTNPDVAHPGEVGTGTGDAVDITGSAAPVVGASVCHFGRVSGLQCGTVQS